MESLLEKPIRYLKGVGPRKAKLFARIGVKTVKDLLYLKPRKYLDRRFIKKISEAKPGEEVTVQGRVITKGVKKLNSRKVFVVLITDDTEWLELVFFNMEFLSSQFKTGQIVVASGKIYAYRRIKVMYHPDWEIKENSEISKVGRIIPIYPATEGLKPSGIEKLIKEALEITEKEIVDYLPEYLRVTKGIPKKKELLRMLHFPKTLQEAHFARKWLAYEEFFLYFLRLKYKALQLEGDAYPLNPDGPLVQKFLESLPFELTDAQKRVFEEIKNDLKKRKPMHRLLQGDVGSGKTVIAVMTMLVAVDSGYQAAMMAPTEILAEQHYMVISRYLKPLGIIPEFLIGKLPQSQKSSALRRIKEGVSRVVIGTHSLIQEDVEFKDLAVAVVDEQHRFGVIQRTELLKKGKKVPHFLVMTATPIPRTLAMTLYGDLDVSYLDEKPAGRVEIKTVWKTERERKKVYDWLFEKIKKEGDRAYVVAPTIEKSEKLKIKSVEELERELREMVPEGVRIGMVHGKMPREERQKIMEDFRTGKINLLVSTTVIEVGIDVTEATIMVIEHAERFGLAQLHQLRGRIGRGNKKSYCILLTPVSITEEAEQRMKILVNTQDGFKIAEMDLRLRGPGEIMGTRQHGVDEFKIGDLLKDAGIIRKAQMDVEKLLREDPYLVKPEHRPLKIYLARESEEGLYAG